MTLLSSSQLAATRDILVCPTEEGRGDEASDALAYALTLAGMAGAHLTVQSAARRLTVVAGRARVVVQNLVADENRRLRSLAQALAERPVSDAASAGVTCTAEATMLAYPDLIARLTARARLADRVVIAWYGSAQAARAANDALPFLRAAEAVEIVSVVGEKDLSTSAAGAEFAPHLARHGVNVSVNVLPVVGDVTEPLRTQVGLFRADMLVMGAYRHSRLQEWFLGGVTQSLLSRSPVPLFLAH